MPEDERKALPHGWDADAVIACMQADPHTYCSVQHDALTHQWDRKTGICELCGYRGWLGSGPPPTAWPNDSIAIVEAEQVARRSGYADGVKRGRSLGPQPESVPAWDIVGGSMADGFKIREPGDTTPSIFGTPPQGRETARMRSMTEAQAHELIHWLEDNGEEACELHRLDDSTWAVRAMLFRPDGSMHHKCLYYPLGADFEAYFATLRYKLGRDVPTVPTVCPQCLVWNNQLPNDYDPADDRGWCEECREIAHYDAAYSDAMACIDAVAAEGA